MLGVSPRPLIRSTAVPCWTPTKTGTATSFGPLEIVIVTVEPFLTISPAWGSDEMTSPAGTVSEVARAVSALNPASSNFWIAAGLLNPLVDGTVARPGPALTVKVTSGLLQKKL